MDYHPVSLKAFRSKRFTVSDVCVHMSVRLCAVWETSVFR